MYSKLIGTSDRPEIKIDWRVYTKDPENLLIRDLVIEGLSLARAQKKEGLIRLLLIMTVVLMHYLKI